MPTISMPKRELLKYLKKKPTDDELKEAISMIGTDMDAFGEVISTEVFPDRPDLLSTPGLARALNHFLGYTTKVDTYTAHSAKHKMIIKESVANVRPHTRCAIVRGLKFDDEKIKEIIDLQEKLHVTFGRKRKKVAIGIYPNEKIDWPCTFTAEKPEDIVFIPLDEKKAMDAKQVLEEHPTGKEYAHLLEGYKTYPVFRDAKGDVLSVPPILNSETVGRVTEETRDVFVECSGHEAKAQEEALTMIVCALADMGGKIEYVTVKYAGGKTVQSPNLETQEMLVDMEYVAERASVPQDKIEKSVQRMGLTMKNGVATIPCYRSDFIHMADVVEEAAIGYGYSNIVPTVPDMHTIGGLDGSTVRDQKIRDVLAGTGAYECMNYHLRPEGVPLANPTTKEYSALRKTLIECLLDTLKHNVRHAYPQNYFELGTVFVKDAKNDNGVREDMHTAYVLCGEDATFSTARQVLETLCSVMGWKVKFTAAEDDRFIPGRCAKVSGAVKGIIGELHPQQLVDRNVMMPASAWEIRIT